MKNKLSVFAGLAGTVIALSLLSAGETKEAIAQMSHGEDHAAPAKFQPIEQPWWLKGLVTTGGLGLIGLELWWFVLSKPQAGKAVVQSANEGIQEVVITVDGGYEPNYILVQAGQPVRLTFDRQDPNHCLEEIRFPAFQITKALPLHQTTAIEFTPDQPGRYEFTCGMNMFRGTVEVQSQSQPAIAPPSTDSSSAKPSQLSFHG